MGPRQYRAFRRKSEPGDIGGESAGGLSTSSNLASPTAKGVFHAAIIEGGAYMLFNVQPVVAQEALGVKFATAVGCTGTNAQIAACLRNAPDGHPNPRPENTK